jgi:DNA-binding FadR family transcriptional regulator
MAKGEKSAARTLAADPVFEALAGAILRGKYPPGSPLPPERELSALFNVSRLIARQALHRLRDMGLVSGGQGGQNTVLDPDDANDPHIIALQMELAPEQTDERDMTERQMIGGAMLLELAELRIQDNEIEELDRMVAAREKDASDDINEFETAFWTFIARCTRNKILLREARWWFDMITHRPERRERFYDRPELRLMVYRSIVDNLKSKSGMAGRLFIDSVKPVWQSRDS